MPVVPWVSTDSLRSPHISPSDCPALTVLLFHTSGLSSFCYLLTVGFQTRYLLASYLKWKDTLPEGHRGLTGSTGGWRARGWSGQTSPGLESCVKRSPARSLSRSLVHKLVWLRGKNIHQLLLRPCATCSRMNVPEDRVFWAKSKLVRIWLLWFLQWEVGVGGGKNGLSPELCSMRTHQRLSKELLWNGREGRLKVGGLKNDTVILTRW